MTTVAIDSASEVTTIWRYTNVYIIIIYYYYIEVASDYEYVTRMERGLKCGVYTV